MRVLVTRPLVDARETETVLKARGHTALVAPMLRVNFHAGPPLELSGVQAILATSANGVRALTQRTGRRDLPLYAVGPQTAATAREAGFVLVRSADGDAAALAAAMQKWASPEDGPLVHASGAGGEGRLASLLSRAGFAVRTENLYDVAAVAELPADIRDALARRQIDAILLFSPRSARTFALCLQRADLASAAAGLTAACISQATAAALAPLAFKSVRVAAKPNQTALLDCLG